MSEVLEITTEDQMRTFLEDPTPLPGILFKYSPTCGISMATEEHWDSFVASSPEGVRLARVDVLGARPAARGISQWIGVLHQSPQVLVLQGGAVVRHTSHYSITQAWLSAALAATKANPAT